jgi:hypothetical protein
MREKGGIFSIHNAHVKVFASIEVAESWFARKTIPKGWRSNMRFWSEPDRPPHHHVQAAAANPIKEAAN